MSPRDFYHVSLKVFLKNQNGEVLILKARADYSTAGFYDLPGGRIDENEFRTPFAEIIKRELKEEVGDGVEVKINPRPAAAGRHLVPANLTKSKEKDLHVLGLFFEAEYLSGDIDISDEHEDHRWVNLAQENIEELFTSGILEGVRMYLAAREP